MLSTLKLLLPAIIPSWRFFASVGPSPRVEYAPSGTAEWREFRPRPDVLAARDMLRSLFWNPERNDSLFLTSCAERLLEAPTAHSVEEIRARVGDAPFRIVLIERRGRRLVREIAYTS